MMLWVLDLLRKTNKVVNYALVGLSFFYVFEPCPRLRIIFYLALIGSLEGKFCWAGWCFVGR